MSVVCDREQVNSNMMTKNTQIGQYSHQGVLCSVVIHTYTLAPNHGCGRICPC